MIDDTREGGGGEKRAFGALEVYTMEIKNNGGRVGGVTHQGIDFRNGLSVADADSDGIVEVSLGGSIPDTVAPAATGVAATDTAALQAAITATPNGGWLALPSGTYKLNAALTVTKNITITGVSGENYQSATTAGTVPFGPTGTPPLLGTVLQMTVAATDIIQITGAGVAVNLKRFGLYFQSGLASTGHGINASPSQVYGSGHDIGLYSFEWEQLAVYGHDGNHYAFYLLNPLLGTLINLRSYGGGGYAVVTDVGAINAGNLVFIHPYADLFNTGTAAGFTHSAASNASPGSLNLLVYIRPQAILSGASQTAGTQYGWNDLAGAGTPSQVNVLGPDMETNGNVTFGSGTQILGTALVTSNQRFSTSVTYGPAAGMSADKTNGNMTAFGYQAAKALTTGGDTTALGNNALADATTAADNTAVGSNAAQHNTGANNTVIGWTAMQGTASNSTGANNVAIGSQAMQSLTTAQLNVAVGVNAALSISTGAQSVFIGKDAGYTTNGSATNAITTSSSNTFIGYQAGGYTANPSQGVAVGHQAWVGPNATAIGYHAQAQTNNAVALGSTTVASANPSLALGYNTQATAAGSVAIGADSGGAGTTTSVSNQIALGTANHHILLKTAAVPADASFAASQFSIWLDPTAGAAKFMIKAKNASGTVVTGSVALA